MLPYSSPQGINIAAFIGLLLKKKIFLRKVSALPASLCTSRSSADLLDGDGLLADTGTACQRYIRIKQEGTDIQP